MHAERDIVLADLSVCLFLRHILVLYLNEWSIVKCFPPSDRNMTLVFERYCHYKIPRELPQHGDGKKLRFSTEVADYLKKTARDRPMITMYR